MLRLPKYNELKLDRLNFKLNRAQVHPPKPNFEPFQTPSKIKTSNLFSRKRAEDPGPNPEETEL